MDTFEWIQPLFFNPLQNALTLKTEVSLGDLNVSNTQYDRYQLNAQYFLSPHSAPDLSLNIGQILHTYFTKVNSSGDYQSQNLSGHLTSQLGTVLNSNVGKLEFGIYHQWLPNENQVEKSFGLNIATQKLSTQLTTFHMGYYKDLNPVQIGFFYSFQGNQTRKLKININNNNSIQKENSTEDVFLPPIFGFLFQTTPNQEMEFSGEAQWIRGSKIENANLQDYFRINFLFLYSNNGMNFTYQSPSYNEQANMDWQNLGFWKLGYNYKWNPSTISRLEYGISEDTQSLNEVNANYKRQFCAFTTGYLW